MKTIFNKSLVSRSFSLKPLFLKSFSDMLKVHLKKRHEPKWNGQKKESDQKHDLTQKQQFLLTKSRESKELAMLFWGIEITKPGESLSCGLISTISPEIGELISLVAFTLSTAPKLLPWETDTPVSGRSTNTTSPKWSC